MKSHLSLAVAALLAAGALLALAQAPDQVQNPAEAAGPAASFVSEPVATVTKTGNADEALLNNIAQAMNGNEALRNAKITVQQDENGTVILTGAALSQDQAQKAADIALAQAGEAKVVNAIQPDKIQYRTWAVIG